MISACIPVRPDSQLTPGRRLGTSREFGFWAAFWESERPASGPLHPQAPAYNATRVPILAGKSHSRKLADLFPEIPFLEVNLLVSKPRQSKSLEQPAAREEDQGLDVHR